ncbi:MAG: response regulator [Rubrivivax sp.]|nr:response regulator [Rubrivivax sp.]
MGVFNFGDPANRRPGWLPASWPTRRGAGKVVMPGCSHTVQQEEPTPADSGPRVLVVDDNPANRMLASEMLALWGINPLLAVDGSEAVALACELPLKLILMDLQMPVLGGLAATRQIRRFEQERSRSRVPIVVYASSVSGSDRLCLQDFGVDGVLRKPCAAHELHECLLRWCPATNIPAAFAVVLDGEGDRPRDIRSG